MPDNESARAGEQRATQDKQADFTNNDAETQAKLARDPGTITFLQSAGDYHSRMTKRFRRGKFGKIEAEQYGRQKHFRVVPILCRNIVELATNMRRAEQFSKVCVIRGAPADGTDWNYTLRRSHSRPNEAATFLDVPRLWAMIDIDKIPCPPATDPAFDPIDAALYAVGLLPPEFRDVSFYWQFSSSQGVSSNDTLSLHLWFYLDRPYTNAELRRYANAANKTAGYRLIDPALFNPVQVHYIARPLFEEGIADPLPIRSGFWRGLDDIATLNIPTPEEKKPAYKAAMEYCPGLGYQGHLANIGDDKGGFYKPIVSAMASYVAANGVDGTDQEAVKADIRAAITAATHGNRAPEEIARYESDKFLDDIFAWVFAREKTKARMPETVTSLPPYYSYPAYANAAKDRAAADMKEHITIHIKKAVRQIVSARAQRTASEFDHCDNDAA